MTRRALVLAGGELEVSDRLRGLAAEADVVIAADAGLRHVDPLGVAPHKIVGDFDSVDPALLERHADVPRQRHPPAKGKLDLELAIEEARARGADRVDVMGALGSRLDQTLAGLLICARLHRDGVPCRLLGRDTDAHPLAADETLRLDAEPGTTFSVVSLDDEVVVSIAGARYGVERLELPFGVGLGVSNVVDRDATVTCHRGLLIAIVERSPHDR